MKYRHSFHAGNFADVLKHVVLFSILKSLQTKPAPFFHLDTHSGRGRYKLEPGAATAGEFFSGFAKLRNVPSLPSPLDEYVALIEQLGADSPGAPLSHYAGSPLIAAHLLRPEDRAAFFELGITEAEKLRIALRSFHNISVQCADGYTALRSQLPPRERRGMVLIDPAYEVQEEEFPLILDALQEGYKRWATGIYAIWYPIKQRSVVARFHEQLKASGIRKILAIELCLYPDDSRVSLNGCGMIVINPPWQLGQTMNAALPVLHRLLGGQPRTTSTCTWLVPE